MPLAPGPGTQDQHRIPQYVYARINLRFFLAEDSAAAIGVAPLPVQLPSKSYLHDLAANMNRRHRSAQMAGRASVQLHTLIFFSGEAGGVTVDAYVLDVDTTYTEGVKPALRVIVPRYGIEGRVELNDVDADDPRLVRHNEGLHKIQYCDERMIRRRLWPKFCYIRTMYDVRLVRPCVPHMVWYERTQTTIEARPEQRVVTSVVQSAMRTIKNHL